MALPNVAPTYQYVGGEQGDGTIIGYNSAALQGFWGATPSAQVAFTNAAVATTAASTAQAATLTSAQFAAVIALVNEIRAAMVSMGLKA